MAQAIFLNGDTASSVRMAINRMEWVDNRDPSQTDDNSDGYHIGNFWVNSLEETVFVCIDNTDNSAKWIKLPLSLNDINGQRKILFGTSTPASSLGENGDIYIQISTN